MDFLNFMDQQAPLKLYPWMESGDFEFILVTPENIAECMDACINGVNGRFALDLETTGIDNRVDASTGSTKDKIVGVCLSGDGKRGWYIPLRHQKGTEHNIPWSLFDREFRRLMAAVDADQVVAIFHNAKFDQEFLEFYGGDAYGKWDNIKRWEDTLILAYIRNSRARRKGLKALSLAPPDADHTHAAGGPGLGMEMLELSDLFPKDHPSQQYDFSLLDPSEEGPRIYGCSDAICTYRLYDVLAPDVLTDAPKRHNQQSIYRIEKGCVIACRWMERNRIQTSPKVVMELIQLGQQEWFDSIMEVYRAASEILGRDVMPGYYKVLKENKPGEDEGGFVANDPLNLLPEQVKRAKVFENRYFPNPLGTVETRGKSWPLIYDVNAPVQLGQMFDEMGVPGLVRTEKSGQVKTSKDVLEMVIEQAADRFPFMQKIRRFRETNKALSSYLFPMLEDVDPTDHTMRINFNPHKVDTGRFSTPAKERELGSAKTKRIPGWPEINLQSMPATYDPRRPACMTRLRECIVARPGYFIVACDFSGEELRLVTNLSREPLWLEEFFRCSSCTRKFSRGEGGHTPKAPPSRCPNCGSDKIGDLHTLTALSIYGEDAPRKPEWKQLRGYAKCVHPDTLVGMFEGGRHAGIRPLRVLSFGDFDQFQPVQQVTTVWSGAEDVPVRSTYNGGTKPLFHVVTRRGILTCTDQHAFVRADGSQASLSTGLSEGDVLAEPEAPHLNSPFWPQLKYRPFEGVPEVEIPTSSELAYAAGAFLGDGAKSGTTTVGISHGMVGKTDKTGVPYSEWQGTLARAFNSAGFAPTKRKKSLYLGSRHVMRFLQALGLVDEVAGGKVLRIPTWVLASGREGALAFLGGLFDTDGTVNKRDAALSLTTKDAVFAGQVGAVLQVLGAVPYMEPVWNKTYERWYYRIRVRASDAPAIASGMKHRGKLARLRPTEPGHTLPNCVLKVIPAGEGPCVDVSLGNKDHLYWANGLLTHNSTNFALCYGGGGNAVVRACSVDKNEGWRIKNQFDATYIGLKNWWTGQHKFANEYGYVRTAFGRNYPVPDIWSADGGFRSKAERNSVNGPIQGCLHGDSRVPTSLGVRRIEDLSGQTFNVWTGTRWTRGRAFPSGLKQLVHTTLTSGLVVRTSPDHRFRVYEDGLLSWVRQEDLTPEMWVVTDARGADLPEQSLSFTDDGNSAHNKKGYQFKGNHEALWELLGLVIGDGSIRDDGLIIHVGGLDAAQQAAFYADRFASALNLSPTVRETSRSEGDNRQPTWQVCFWDTAFREFCRTLGLGDWNTYTKRVPEAVWSQSARHRAAFLRGYFSADGCVNIANAVDVRSTNPDLLMDTHKLLRSIGIRSTVRLDSKRVSVKDRVAYRDHVGFLIPEKSERLSAIEENPWTGQWHALPQGLIKQIGETVYKSSIYAALPREEKSAVLRLKAGSGSKPQCLRYLAKIPPEEVSDQITSLLGFDYEQVVAVEDTGVQVEMYDIEVGDCVHAFVCDGVIVHNSGADIIKIAMWLIHRHCKSKGWLDLCRMIATMHDELVFEMHESVIEQAIEEIVPIMTSNPLILKQGWPVPLTTDTEIGHDWTVSWDLNGMRYREVRFEGDKKVKEPKAPSRKDFDSPADYDAALEKYQAAKAAWEAMPHSYPATLRKCFKQAGSTDPGESSTPAEASPPSTEPPIVAEGPAVVEPPVTEVDFHPPRGGKPGDFYDFTLKAPLTAPTCVALSEVIATCKGRGTRKLRLKLPDGSFLEGWGGDKGGILVNDQQFYYLAEAKGL